ncbi:hypothetical protein NX722_03335 [Endozoicomonas gorgoniicola]|uniref:Uncharacterized protein n=1 Tax=Endozoicomonas gorgoniicola TaxID=1234144 RepID=A0ABT3MQP2_9GAMM|nr:hypothetical protein [Endozoicomonas gorgoniicola]MCW7551691.1 hypothetical protein [Endozoicomonas gorgoniicola]
MRTFCQRFLLISFLLQSVSANAVLAPIAHDLTRIAGMPFDKTIQELSKFDNWASELGHSGVYQWLHSNLTLDGSTYTPLQLLNTNAHAIWWFIQHSIDEENLTINNSQLTALANIAIDARTDETFIPNFRINRLLESAFSISENPILGEALFNIITSHGSFQNFPFNYDSLIQAALPNRNYRLINLILGHKKFPYSSHYVRLILKILATQPQIWEERSTDSLEFDDEGFSYEPYPNDNMGGTFYVNPYFSHSEDREPTPSEFDQILNWLRENQQRNPRAFQEALIQARNNHHCNAMNWLTSIGITEMLTQNEPETDENETADESIQPQVETRSLFTIITSAICLRIWPMYGTKHLTAPEMQSDHFLRICF